jgi:hypothetical protein
MAVVAASSAAAGFAVAAGEGPVSVAVGTRYFSFSTSFTPKKIGRNEPTPVNLVLSGEPVEPMGSFEPAIQEMAIEFDRHLTLNAEDLPTCNPRFRSEKLCRRALIGKGEATVLFVGEDPGEPLRIPTRLELYNGGKKDGAAVVYVELRLPDPWMNPSTEQSGCGRPTADCTAPEWKSRFRRSTTSGSWSRFSSESKAS